MTEPVRVAPTLTDQLVSIFQEEQVDYVPDPMVLRAADLFIGGTEFVKKIPPVPNIGLDAGAKITAEGVWATIDKNIDGLIAFFHLLMTRERVPLIDYGETFDRQNFQSLIGSIAVDLHPPHALYTQFLADARDKVASFDLGRLPREMINDCANEVISSGYGWLPEPGIDGLDTDQRTAAALLIGGLIFGSYAVTIRGDHLMQTKRARLFAELTIEPGQQAQWGWEKESELFKELDALVRKDPQITTRERHLPPTVLTLLLEEAKNPRDLLDRALRMREEDEWKDYRRWYGRLRKAWADGRHDSEAEADVQRVTEEIRKRLAQRQRSGAPIPLSEKEIAFKAKLIVGVPGIKAEVSFENITLPQRLRNWYVDTVQMRDHRKLLLRMSLAQEKYDKLTLGLSNVWHGRA